MKVSKTILPAITFAQELGYRVSRTNGGHIRFTKPGRRTIFTSSTPSDWRAPRNVMSQLRRNEELH